MALMYNKIVDTTELGFEIRPRLGKPGHAIVPLDDSDDYEEAERLAREAGLIIKDGVVLNAAQWSGDHRFVVTASIQVAYNMASVTGGDLYYARRAIEQQLESVLGELVGNGGLTAHAPELTVDDYDIVVLPGIH